MIKTAQIKTHRRFPTLRCKGDGRVCLLDFCAHRHGRNHRLHAACSLGAVQPVPLVLPYHAPSLPPLLQPDQSLGLSDLPVDLFECVGEHKPRCPRHVLHLKCTQAPPPAARQDSIRRSVPRCKRHVRLSDEATHLGTLLAEAEGHDGLGRVRCSGTCGENDQRLAVTTERTCSSMPKKSQKGRAIH